MGSIRVFKGSALLFFFLCTLPAWPNSSTLTADISRLENLSTSAPSANERSAAFLQLSRLHQLSGNPEAALKTNEDALRFFPGDSRFLLEQGRLAISLGEYDKAAVSAAALLSRDENSVLEGRYLFAQIEAFRSGNVNLLLALAEDPAFSQHKAGLYYTLWHLTGNNSYKTRLNSEAAGSPEAAILANSAHAAPSPLWLLWPGRNSITLSAPQGATTTTPTVVAPTPQPPPAQAASPSPATVQTPVAAAVAAPAAPSTAVLQTGVFGREENAHNLAARLHSAGFESRIQQRSINGNDHWAVLVPEGANQAATIKRLKDAGFESFPVR